MWIVCLADISHEMSSLIFFWKIKNKYFNVLSAVVELAF